MSVPSYSPRARAQSSDSSKCSNRLLHHMEPRRSARVNAPGQSTDTPERRKPPRRRVPTPPLSTSRQAKRTTRVRPLVPSLVAEILVSPDLLPHMLEHLSMRQLHRVSAVCRAFRAAVPTALLLRRALCPKPTRGAHVITRARNLPSRTRTRPCALPSLRWQSWSASGVRRMLWRCLMGALWLQIATTIASRSSTGRASCG